MRLRRLFNGRIILGTAGGIVAAVAALVGSTIVVMETSWGGEHLRRFAAAQVNKRIEGHLDIGRLAFRGDRITLWDVALRDPEGEPVAFVARLEVEVAVARLLRRELCVKAIAVETPRLDLVGGSRGLNLSRATAPRTKAAPTPRKPKAGDQEGWVVRLEHFSLTGGAVTFVVAKPTESGTESYPKLDLTDLRSSVTARYATGNGSLDLSLWLEGQSARSPTGPLALSADAKVRGDVVSVSTDGSLLGGTWTIRGSFDRRYPKDAEVRIAVGVPAMSLGGYAWGPLKVEGEAHAGSVPAVELLMRIPGVELIGRGGEGDDDDQRFEFAGRLGVSDLAVTASAVRAVTGIDVPPLAGSGKIDLSLLASGFASGSPARGAEAPAAWKAAALGRLDALRLAGVRVARLSLDAVVGGATARIQRARLKLTVDDVRSGATLVRGLTLAASLDDRSLAGELNVTAPARMKLGWQAGLDEDGQGAVLRRLGLAYPGAAWTSEAPAHLRFSGDAISLANLRLMAGLQALSFDGEKRGDLIDAHLMLANLRLELFPAPFVPATLRLAGTLGIELDAHGRLSSPNARARVWLQGGRVKGFARLDARADGTLADSRVQGAIHARAPFADVDATFNLPVDPAGAPAAPADVRVDVSRLLLAGALRAAQLPAYGDGRISLLLRGTGSAQRPSVDLVMNGDRLQVNAPAGAPDGASTTELGRGRVHAAYANGSVRANVAFAAAHGGTLRVEAQSPVDLSYPAVTLGIAPRKLPIQAKIRARHLDVAWLSQFNARLQTLSGKVDAKARLAGSIGDPQFVGDVRWLNGKLVATTHPTLGP
jgi:hypothetical protein